MNGNYKLWHLIVAFVVGVGLVFGLNAASGSMAQGKLTLGKTCSVSTCDLDKKLDQLLALFKQYSGALDNFTVFTGQWTVFTGQWTMFTEGINSFAAAENPDCNKVCDQRLGTCKLVCS